MFVSKIKCNSNLSLTGCEHTNCNSPPALGVSQWWKPFNVQASENKEKHTLDIFIFIIWMKTYADIKKLDLSMIPEGIFHKH